MDLNPKLWHGKRVLLTGHTGFKGSWLTLLLRDLGAEVVGFSLPPNSSKSLYTDARIRTEISSEFIQDIRDRVSVDTAMSESRIDYVFHLAAQAYVRRSVKNPIESFTTNIIGTANVLTSALATSSVLGVTVVTTDKVYENLGEKKFYSESDRLGGKDPYSSSKAAAELVVASIISSNNPRCIPVTTVRGGNVIGGGDWGEERLVPDLVHALQFNSTLSIRNPNATRPWQYVLDCLFGYLLVAQSHIEKKTDVPKSVNFGPKESLSVIEVVSLFEGAFEKKVNHRIVQSSIPEAGSLALDSSLARAYLGWSTSFSQIEAVIQTAKWYNNFKDGADAKELMLEDISKFKQDKW